MCGECSGWPGCRTPIGPPAGCSRWRRRWPGTTGTTSRTATARRLTTCSPGLRCCLRGRTCGGGWRPWTRPLAPWTSSCSASRASVAGLASLLTGEPSRAWRDWLRWRVIRRAAAYLSDERSSPKNFDFYGRMLTGTPELRARWKRGVSLVEGAMGEAVGAHLRRAGTSRRGPEERMDVLVANLVEAYRQSICTLDWMGRRPARGPWTSSGSSRRRSATRIAGGTTPASGSTRRIS